MTATGVPTMADLLRAAFPAHTAKRAAAAGGMSHRTVQDWLQRRCCPSADTLLRLAAENEALRAELLRRLGGTAFVDSGMAQGGAALACETPAPSSTADDEQGRQSAPAPEADAAGLGAGRGHDDAGLVGAGEVATSAVAGWDGVERRKTHSAP